jgi:mono/diheme cytochrome c family protein
LGWAAVGRRYSRPALMVFGLSAAVLSAQTRNSARAPNGKELFQAACVACHGPDGRGAPQAIVGFETPLPDFTDCSFASREPETDWIAVVHNGGPARGFSEIMPAFGEALSRDEIQSVVSYVRGICRDRAWPRGDLNLPRPMVIEKAFPEDEVVLTTSIATAGPGAVSNLFVYEKRFGARSQIELKTPLSALHLVNGGWRGGVGDSEVGYKRALFHSLRTGSILSVGGEVVLPTGNRSFGTGTGTTVFEPYVAAAQILPRDGFMHFQGGIEVPRNSARAAKETFWRAAAGRSFNQDGGLGRSWSPMLEVLAARQWQSGSKSEWDLIPQMQVTLNKRQHILASVGFRVPVSNTTGRAKQLMFYLLWDWYDGGLRDGW